MTKISIDQLIIPQLRILKQSLDDKIDAIDVIVRTPAGNRVALNGVLLSEVEDGESVIFHWQSHYPIPAYLIAIASTDYAVFSDFVELNNGQSIEILNYVYPENLDIAQEAYANTVQIMELYNELFGLYPFAVESIEFDPDLWICSRDNSTEKVDYVTGVDNLLAGNKIKLYPNPSRDFVIVDLQDKESTNGRITLHNQLGQKIGEWPIESVQTRIKTTSFPSGAYTLKIETSNGTIIKLLEIE